MLFVTAIDRQAQWRNFSCQLDELELALDVAHSIACQGDTLINVCLLDGTSRLELPAAAFDEHPFTEVIQQLRAEWEFVLAQPVRSARSPMPSGSARQRLHALQEAKIQNLRRTIRHLQALIDTSQRVLLPSLRQERSLRHYQRLVDRQRSALARAEAAQVTL